MKAAALIVALLLAGCASGVHMTDEERIACRDSGCSVWTPAELLRLVGKAAGEGYQRGWRDANVQSGKGA
jgi:hypothetical protein